MSLPTLAGSVVSAGNGAHGAYAGDEKPGDEQKKPDCVRCFHGIHLHCHSIRLGSPVQSPAVAMLQSPV